MSLISKKILSDKGGPFNRAARRIFLMPCTLQETERYLVSRGIHWSRYDIVECYMTMGGIPYYLKLLDNELSYLANIDAVFSNAKVRYGMNLTISMRRFLERQRAI